MHNIALGITKKTLRLWIGSPNAPYYLNKTKLAILNQRIKAIKPTSEIPRKPRTLKDVSNFTANELMAYLLYYAPVCLSGILPQKYLKHFRVLSNCIHYLLRENISVEKLDEIESDLDQFVEDFELLYGGVNCTLNIHLVKHIVHSVRNFGPLWVFSAFSNESFNSVLTNFVTGNTDVLHQICSKYILSKLLNKNQQRILNSDYTITFLGKAKNVVEERLQFKFTSSDKIHTMTNVELNVYQRMKFKNTVYTSHIYTRAKNTIDYFVGLDNGIFGVVKYYLVMDGQKFALIQQFSEIGVINQSIQIRPSNVNVMANVECIKKKFIYITFKTILFKNDTHFIVEQPNHFETD